MPKKRPKPCDACKSRKTRCVVEENGVCAYCNLHRIQCTFGQQNEDASSGANLQPERSNASARAIANSDKSPADTARSVSHADLGHIPAQTLGLAQERFAELYGLTSDMEPILMRHRPYDSTTQEYRLDTHSIRRVRDRDEGQVYPLTFHLVSDNKTRPAISAAWEAIESCVHPHGPRLVQLFWRMVHVSYPILSKESFMETCTKSYQEVHPALLGSIYLITLSWWSYDTELSICKSPDRNALRKLTLNAIQESYHRPKLSSIQAILLYLQCKPEDPLNPDHTFTWSLVSQALAIAEALGLHLDATDWSIPSWEQTLRKRLAWALFVQDKWTSIAYGRPSHIHAGYWNVRDLTLQDFDVEVVLDDDFLRTYETAGIHQFVHTVSLTVILSDIQIEFMTTSRAVLQDTKSLYDRALRLVNSLDEWRSSLPLDLQTDIKYRRQLNPHACLHLLYHGVVMNLLRRLIRSTVLPPRCESSQITAEIRKLGYDIAQSAMTLIARLRLDHLEAFWYSAAPYVFSLIGSFITLLLVTSLSLQERSHWQDQLNSYLWTLRTMSKSSEPMQYAVNRLEGAILRGLEHALAVNVDESGDFRLTQPNPLSEAAFTDVDLASIDLDAFDWLGGINMND